MDRIRTRTEHARKIELSQLTRMDRTDSFKSVLTGKRAMSEDFKPVRVAVNVMRARLTVIGFNIAIVSFQLPQLYGQSGGIELTGMDHAVHVTAMQRS